MEPLVDAWEREIRSLRVSVTDKCNFRCRYCMPADGLEWLERDELLTFEEIERLVRVLAAMGVEEVRLTGGEPLVRRDLPVLVNLTLLVTAFTLIANSSAELASDMWSGREVRA